MENTQFWEMAYNRNAPLLRGVLRRYVPDREIVQDLLHEVFVTAIYKEKSFSGKGSFDGWLYRIAVNTALMYLRKCKSGLSFTDLMTVEHDEEVEEQEDSEEERKTIEDAGFSNEELLQAIDRLPDHHRLVFNLYVMDGYTHKQIAGELRISVGTSKSHLARARKKLQYYLYEDALRKKKERRALFIPVVPAGGDFIDRLYRSGFSGYSIPGVDSAGFIAGVVGQQAALSVPAAFSWLGKWGVLGACCGTAAVTALVCWGIMGDPVSGDREKAPPVVLPDSTGGRPEGEEALPVVDDTLLLEPAGWFAPKGEGKGERDTSKMGSEGTASEQTVVVKKKIVERKTVVVRDTVFLSE